MVSGARRIAVKLLVCGRILWLALSRYGDPVRTARALWRLSGAKSRYRPWIARKYARVGRQYYTDFYVPGWPSRAFDRFIEGELDRVLPFRGSAPRLQTVILAITKKCGFRCEHCCEWDALNGAESLTRDDLRGVLADFQRRGAAQVLLSGGEPLHRFDDVVHLLETAETTTAFWVVTSGYGFTADRAVRLRRAGLAGVVLSLDHWDRMLHDRFRGYAGAYDGVEQAAGHAHRAGLAVCLSLCPTRDFVSPENLDRYAQTARRLGAAFIQVVEPKAVGHYAWRDVDLGPTQRRDLEAFYWRVNTDPGLCEMPLVAYPDFTRRRVQCFGAGNRLVYMDTDGQLHPCPFCRTSSRSAIGNLDDALASMCAAGCPSI